MATRIKKRKRFEVSDVLEVEKDGPTPGDVHVDAPLGSSKKCPYCGSGMSKAAVMYGVCTSCDKLTKGVAVAKWPDASGQDDHGRGGSSGGEGGKRDDHGILHSGRKLRHGDQVLVSGRSDDNGKHMEGQGRVVTDHGQAHVGIKMLTGPHAGQLHSIHRDHVATEKEQVAAHRATRAEADAWPKAAERAHDQFHADRAAGVHIGAAPKKRACNHSTFDFSTVAGRSYAKRDGQFFKVDDAHGIAFGWAIVSTVDGEPYFDTQGDHIPMDACIRAAEHFMKHSRAGDEQHDERRAGDVPFCMPVTSELAKSLFGADVNQEGLVIGFKPYDRKLLEKIKSGERRGFSIGGSLSQWSDDVAKRFAKSYEDTQGVRRVFEDFQIDFISSVDWPAMEGALVAVVKSADGATHEPVLWMRKDLMPPKKQPPGAGPQAGAQPNAQPPMTGAPGQPAPGAPMPMARMPSPGPGGAASPGGGVQPTQSIASHPTSPMGMIGMSPARAAAMSASGMGGSLPAPTAKLTGESDGHQHALNLGEAGEDGVGYTGFGISSNGVSHRHPFVMHPDGSVEVGVNDGHTHNADGSPNMGDVGDGTEDELDPEDVADGGLDDDMEGDASAGEFDNEPFDNSGDQGESLADQAASPSLKPGSTLPDDKKKNPFSGKRAAQVARQNAERGLASVSKENAMDPQQMIASLKKQLADVTAVAEMTDAEKEHYRSLAKRDQPEFLTASSAKRAEFMKAAGESDEVVYNCDDGTVIRKSHGELAAKLARRNDENTAALRKQLERSEALELEKRAQTIMKRYPGKDDVKGVLLKAIDRACETVGKDGKVTTNEELRKGLLALVKAGDDALAKSYKRYGKAAVDGVESASDDPDDKLEVLAKAYAKENKVSYAKAYEEVLKTVEGEDLYAESAGGDRVGANGQDDAVDDYEDDDGDYEVIEDGKPA